MPHVAGRITSKAGGKQNSIFAAQGKCDHVRNVKVLSQEEWRRLNDQLHYESMENAKLEDKRIAVEKLKGQSHEMVKNWTNTFLGARQKKLDERAKRLEDEEKAKVEIDIEEAKFQAQLRREAIEDAKIKLYYQTDRVKTFHIALSLTEVLKERNAQLEFKELKNQLATDKDRVYVEKWRRELDEAALKEQEKQASRRAKNVAVAQHVLGQAKEKRELKEQDIEERRLEGEALRRLVIEDQLERERIEQLEKIQSGDLRKQYMDHMEGNKQMRMIERLKEEEEDEKNRIFAAAKKKMMTLRVFKERELFHSREEQMERIREYLAAQKKRVVDDEDGRIKQVVAEKEEAELQRELEKARNTAERVAEIEAHRLESIQRHRQEEEAAKMAELEEVRVRNAAERAVAEYEMKCRAHRHEKLKALNDEYLVQKDQTEENKKKSRQHEIEMAGAGNRLAKQEEEVFQDYTRRVITHCKANGRNVYPLELAARQTSQMGLKSSLPGATSVLTLGKPGVQSNNNSSQVSRSESASSGAKPTTKSESKDRLGFVW